MGKNIADIQLSCNSFLLSAMTSCTYACTKELGYLITKRETDVADVLFCRELMDARDGISLISGLTKSECTDLLDFLCTA